MPARWGQQGPECVIWSLGREQEVTLPTQCAHRTLNPRAPVALLGWGGWGAGTSIAQLQNTLLGEHGRFQENEKDQ